MKPNYVPDWPTYSPEQIAERNEYIDMLCAKLQPSAHRIFTSAIMRQTANESAEALAEEARSVLLDVLAESGNRLEIDEESHRLQDALMIALTQEPEILNMNVENKWIERRSKDLARAIVGFWVNLAEDEELHYEASCQFLNDMYSGRESVRGQKFEIIFSRFWLDWEEATSLLEILHNIGTEGLVDQDYKKLKVEQKSEKVA